MRIIGGRLSRRRIITPLDLPVRPTTDLAKESLFNLLEHRTQIEDANVLDLFAGSGNISYEFASRGARQVIAIEHHPKNIAFIHKTLNAYKLDEIQVIKSDVFDFLERNQESFDIIFADPPFDFDRTADLIRLIFKKRILREKAWMAIEHPGSIGFEQLPHFEEMRRYGRVHFSLFSDQKVDVHTALQENRIEWFEKQLRDDPALLQYRDESGRGLICLAAYYGQPKLVAWLSAQKKTFDFWELLCLRRTDELAEMLASDRQLIESVSPDGYYPLGLAAWFGFEEMVELFLDAGADINCISENEMLVSPLHSAAAQGHLSTAALLISRGADVNIRQAAEVSALHSAAYSGFEAMAELLLNAGADPQARMEDGKTPIQLALEAGHKKTAKLIRKHF